MYLVCQVFWGQLDSQRAKLQETVDSLKESIQELKEEQSAVLQDKRRTEKAHRGKLVSGPKEGGMPCLLTTCCNEQSHLVWVCTYM